MKNIFIIIFSLITFQITGQDTIKVNLINTNTEQSLTTANLPIFRIFSKNTTDKTWIILENIRYHQHLEWLWTVEIQDDKGNIYTKKANWSIIHDNADKFETKVVITKANHYLNATLYLAPYLNDFMYESWQYYTFLPGEYRIRLTYQLPINPKV